MLDNKIPAEANVNGIIRGGYLIKNKFCFHAGLMYIETEDFQELKILEECEKDRNER